MKKQIPTNIDWRTWIRRWDRMQDHYIPARKERFEIIVRLITNTQPNGYKQYLKEKHYD